MKELWTETHRPKTLGEYVWRDDRQKEIVSQWIKEGSIPNLLLSGSPGVGKSSLINMLIHELGIEEFDIMEKNASEATSINVVRDEIIGFASTQPWGKFKVVILEEAESMSLEAQKSLKRVIEESSSVCRFIFTTNEPHRINSAIKSRCQGFHIESLKEDEFLLKLASILDIHSIEYEPDTLIAYSTAMFPDLRSAINAVQQNSIDGKLHEPSSDTKGTMEYMVTATMLLKKGSYQLARETIVSNASYDDYLDIYRFLYKNLDLWTDDKDKQDEALIIIRDGLYKDSIIADREINLAATLLQINGVI